MSWETVKYGLQMYTSGYQDNSGKSYNSFALQLGSFEEWGGFQYQNISVTQWVLAGASVWWKEGEYLPTNNISNNQ